MFCCKKWDNTKPGANAQCCAKPDNDMVVLSSYFCGLFNFAKACTKNIPSLTLEGMGCNMPETQQTVKRYACCTFQIRSH